MVGDKVRALLTPKYPVGKMSAMSSKALSDMVSGALKMVPSANGTRTYSAWPPSRKREPNKRLFSHRAVKPLLQ